MPKKRTTVPRICEYCGNEFQARFDAVKDGKGRFCSRSCSSRANNPPTDVETRFWSKVNKTSGCWEWTGKQWNKTWYGVFWLNGRNHGAHRIAYELSVGPIPPGLCVLHICDNPLCVRPDHLRLGTHAENRADCVAKGRQAKGATYWAISQPEKLARGERHWGAKLTEEQVRDIRARTDMSGAAIAREYGISRTTVYDIRNRRIWTHI